MSFAKPLERSCKCRINFHLDADFHVEKVNIYYGLKQFNQNYRFLAQSKDPKQLRGQSIGQLDKRCSLVSHLKNISYFPCGGMANIMFDDSFSIYSNENTSLVLNTYNIALENTRNYHYKNKPANKDYSKPPRWKHDIWSLDESNEFNNGVESGPFIVWMTEATFDDFYKLHSITIPKEGVLKKGHYKIDVTYRYGVFYASKTRKFLSIVGVEDYGILNIRLLSFLLILVIIYFLLFIIVTLKLHEF